MRRTAQLLECLFDIMGSWVSRWAASRHESGFAVLSPRSTPPVMCCGQPPRHPVTVVVTTTLGELDQAARAMADTSIPMPAPARTGGGSPVPMPDLIRMSANAIHYLAVFADHTGRPLYLGRQKRIATADQRLICYARDRGCTRPDCVEPGYRCEVHHSPDWARGGRTDADKLFFACGCDHDAASRGQLHTVVTDGGRLGWIDGSEPPAINHAHHPGELLRGGPDPPRDGQGRAHQRTAKIVAAVCQRHVDSPSAASPLG